MYDRRNNLSGQVAADVRENLGTLVYDTVIPRNVRLSEAPSHAVPALIYDRTSSGSLAYQRLAGELLARMGAARRGRDGRERRSGMERRVSGAGCRRCWPTSPRSTRRRARRRAAPAPAPTRVPIDRIRANPNQPRRDFDEKELAGPRRLDPREGRDPAADPAAASGRAPASYEIVAGERRWRAAQIAGVHELPAVVRELSRRRGARARDHREHPARRPQRRSRRRRATAS